MLITRQATQETTVKQAYETGNQGIGIHEYDEFYLVDDHAQSFDVKWHHKQILTIHRITHLHYAVTVFDIALCNFQRVVMSADTPVMRSYPDTASGYWNPDDDTAGQV